MTREQRQISLDDQPDPEPRTHYQVNVRCQNCGMTCETSIPLGITLAAWACSNCECIGHLVPVSIDPVTSRVSEPATHIRDFAQAMLASQAVSSSAVGYLIPEGIPSTMRIVPPAQPTAMADYYRFFGPGTGRNPQQGPPTAMWFPDGDDEDAGSVEAGSTGQDSITSMDAYGVQTLRDWHLENNAEDYREIDLEDHDEEPETTVDELLSICQERDIDTETQLMLNVPVELPRLLQFMDVWLASLHAVPVPEKFRAVWSCAAAVARTQCLSLYNIIGSPEVDIASGVSVVASNLLRSRFGTIYTTSQRMWKHITMADSDPQIEVEALRRRDVAKQR